MNHRAATVLGLVAPFAWGVGGGCVNRGQVAPTKADGSVETGGQTGSGGHGDGLGGASDGSGGAAGGAAGTPGGAGGMPAATGGAPGAGGFPGGSGGTPAGTGGAPTGAGGMPTGLGGMPGGDAGVNPCVPGVSPAVALLTSFSPPTWNDTLAQWGTAGNLTGTIFRYGGGKMLDGGPTTLIAPPSVDTTSANPALSIRGDVVAADYGGIGMPFDQCVNTTAYGGVRFTLGGTTAGCDLFLQLQTYSQVPVSSNGACVANCFQFPHVKLPPIGTGAITVTFAALAGSGLPATAAGMRAEIVGLQLQFQSPAPGAGGQQPSCLGINMTLDDLQLVPN